MFQIGLVFCFFPSSRVPVQGSKWFDAFKIFDLAECSSVRGKTVSSLPRSQTRSALREESVRLNQEKIELLQGQLDATK
jgi:hypothetical protein